MYFQRATSEMLEKVRRDSAYKPRQSTKMKNIKEDTKTSWMSIEHDEKEKRLAYFQGLHG
jgi:hypothetical protein